MGKYTQANRPWKVSTDLGDDVLLLEGFSGEEGMSTPFSFTLDLLSDDPSVDAADLLHKPAIVDITLPDGGERTIHGLISRFVQLDRIGDLAVYRAELVPWLWFLSLSSACKIFQNLSVLEIAEQVFKAQGYSDFEIKCTKSYAKRDYCVQYRETDLNFVSRLLEEEGIFYFFQHSNDKHVLTLADANSAVKPCPGQATARMAAQSGAWQAEDVVTGLRHEHAVSCGKVTLRNYDYLQPALQLESSVSGNGGPEVYDYPGSFTQLEVGERQARLLLEEQEAWQQVVRGESSCRAFQSGYRFDLQEHYRAGLNQTYQLLYVRHAARAGGFLPGDSGGADYHNSFVAIPYSVPFRPLRTARRPIVQGSQTALVVGKSGEEIWVDKYGRVKVQFYWDRDGKKDENSSCWVRVATPSAGKGWGSVQIPRIGQEVIVDFLEGDPDRPIIVGSVYNAEQTAPYDLPGGGIKMGMKSRSSKGGGGYNEISLDDTKGKEGMTVHAQYDMSTTVEHDETTTVHNNRTIAVDGTHTETIGKDTTINVTGGKQSNTVNKEVEITSQTSSIHVAASTEIQLEVGSTTLLVKPGEVSVNGQKIAITGLAEVTLGVGANSVKIDPSGVTIFGTLVKIN